MRRALLLSGGLMAVLALSGLAASVLVEETAQAWFERDLVLRARLAVTGARRLLATRAADDDPSLMRALLSDLATDERLYAVAACTASGQLIAKTELFPAALPCPTLRSLDDQRVSHERGPSGPLHVIALPIGDASGLRGSIVLAHDLGFVVTRQSKLRGLLAAAFGALALLGAVVSFIGGRMSWRRWNRELRRLLSGTPSPREAAQFQPLLRDVRELAARLGEHEGEAFGRWTNTTLKQALQRQLEGERVIIVANREPYMHERRGAEIKVVHPASGLVTALEPVMRACSGVWIAHGSGSADAETVDKSGHVRVPPGEESYLLRRVWLSKEEEQGYYYGFSNEGLWPLCHIAHARPVFRRSDWEQYKAVNQKFADTVVEEATSDDPVVLVQDYHFALAPALIRQRLPRATILTFWHIPWPNAERISMCPWREELIAGLLGSSILGFHTQQHCNNFFDSVDAYLESRIDHERFAVVHQGRHTLVKPYPISIEWPNRQLDGLPDAPACRASVIAELGLRPDALLGLGVDRLDYTKGVEERLLAVEQLLDRFPQYRGRFSFVQLAAPSRTIIERYRQLNHDVEAITDRVNQKYGSGSYRPIILLRAHHEQPTVFRYYRAADVCYVSSLHDGMNLVAKEFVAAREDGQGVLVLSHFTGAARELTEALIVNPYDLETASSALHVALSMSVDERAARMQSLRAVVSEFNVYRWAGRMIVDAARLRRHERVSASLTHDQR